jgi:hypothetical protein
MMAKVQSKPAPDQTQVNIERFMKLFCGFEFAYGQHTLFPPDPDGKIKGKAVTHTGKATEQHYLVHLEGTGASLGIIPLRGIDVCSFGAIDIDIKGEVKLSEPIETLEKRIRALELPLVVCRSKSGGAHLYLFANPPVPAKLMQSKLMEFTAILGYTGCEVFPKQVMRVNENDRGNWINIAYYGSLSKQGTTRYALKNGKPIHSLADFLDYAELMTIQESDLAAIEVKMDDSFADAPPCLQHFATFGVPDNRNTATTGAGVYYQRKNPEDWEELTRQFNDKFCSPNMDSAEINQIIRNLNAKQYFYQCKQPPLCNHCDKSVCKNREFGIGGQKRTGGNASELFPLTNLVKCVSKDSVRWYAEHEGCRVELTTDQLMSPLDLQKIFLEKFSKVILIGKTRDWLEHLADLVAKSEVIYDPEDASKRGQFENTLQIFLTSGRKARTLDEITKGNRFEEDDKAYFRSETLLHHLSQHNVDIRRPQEIWSWLKELGADTTQRKVKGRTTRLWFMPAPEVSMDDNLEEM